MSVSSIRLVVVVALALGLGAAGCAAAGPLDRARSGATLGAVAEVVHVVDGDTVELRIGGDVLPARLLGIDTPETVKPGTPVECFGPEASARTKSLLPAGTEVLVQRDTEARDRFARLLVYLWRAADGLFVNRSLVAGGYARILSISPNTAHRADLAAAAGEAARADRGLWGRCPPGPSP